MSWVWSDSCNKSVLLNLFAFLSGRKGTRGNGMPEPWWWACFGTASGAEHCRRSLESSAAGMLIEPTATWGAFDCSTFQFFSFLLIFLPSCFGLINPVCLPLAGHFQHLRVYGWERSGHLLQGWPDSSRDASVPLSPGAHWCLHVPCGVRHSALEPTSGLPLPMSWARDETSLPILC